MAKHRATIELETQAKVIEDDKQNFITRKEAFKTKKKKKGKGKLAKMVSEDDFKSEKSSEK